MKPLRHLVHCVSAIFLFPIFPKRKCNSHSSFFILHSSFFILHSSFKKSPSVGRVTARYFTCFLLFLLTNINEKANNVYFSKKYPQKFWQFRKKQYLCTRFPENGTAETNKLLTQTVKKGSKKKEFFEKIYINRQVVQEASLTLFIMHRLG